MEIADTPHPARQHGDVFAKVMTTEGAGPMAPEFFEGVDHLSAAVARAQALTDLGARHVVVEGNVVGADRWTMMFMDSDDTRGKVGTWRGWAEGRLVSDDVDAAAFLADGWHPAAAHTLNCLAGFSRPCGC